MGKSLSQMCLLWNDKFHQNPLESDNFSPDFRLISSKKILCVSTELNIENKSKRLYTAKLTIKLH